MSYRFQPPRTDPRVIRAVNLVYPLFMRLHDDLVGVRVEPEEWRRLEELRGGRALILANHPSQTEPVVMAALARRLGQPFHYLATHEMFHGATGWIVNRMGAFSIRRGWPDRASLRASRQLLAEQGRQLVIFPEGETHMQNELILPLHPGAVQIGFWSLERLEQLGKPPSLPLLPVVIKYRYVADPRPALLRGIARLERHLGLPDGGDQPLLDRVSRAGGRVLDGVESEYGIDMRRRVTPPPINDRIAALHDHIAARVIHVLHVPMPAERSVHLRMRALFNAAIDYIDGLAEGKTPYERRLHARRLHMATACLADLWRVQNFMVISAESLAPPVEAEQLGEVLFRLEKEVFGRPRTRLLREAVVRIGPPLELADRLPGYRQNRRAAVARCTQEVEGGLRSLLESMASVGTPL